MIETNEEFWELVQKQANEPPHLFRSDYYRYKGAIESIVKSIAVRKEVIDWARNKIKNYSYTSDD